MTHLPLARAVSLALLLAGTPALATETDTDVEDTGVVDDTGDVDTTGERTAAEVAGEEGGADCSAIGSSALGLPLMLVGLVITRSRRR